MIRMEIQNSEEFLRALANKPKRIVEVVAGRVSRLMMMLSSYVVSRKLSGQVLKVRTGVLRASVHPMPTALQGNTIIGAVQAAEGVAFYGSIQEHGSTNAYEIIATKARALSFMSHGKRVFARSVTHPPMKKRVFMGPSQDENEQNIRAQIEAAVNEVINE